MLYGVKLAQKYNIPYGQWQPATTSSGGLLDPTVKNSWDILPRTKPATILNLLSSTNNNIFCSEIYSYYIQSADEIANHSINDAMIGTPAEQVILFEFRDVPFALKNYLPPEMNKGNDEKSEWRVNVPPTKPFLPLQRR